MITLQTGSMQGTEKMRLKAAHHVLQ